MKRGIFARCAVDTPPSRIMGTRKNIPKRFLIDVIGRRGASIPPSVFRQQFLLETGQSNEVYSWPRKVINLSFSLFLLLRSRRKGSRRSFPTGMVVEVRFLLRLLDIFSTCMNPAVLSSVGASGGFLVYIMQTPFGKFEGPAAALSSSRNESRSWRWTSRALPFTSMGQVRARQRCWHHAESRGADHLIISVFTDADRAGDKSSHHSRSAVLVAARIWSPHFVALYEAVGRRTLNG